jgi:hypothetical protein
MIPPPKSKVVQIAPCPGCGNKPGGAVQVGAGFSYGWLECKACCRRTAEGKTFDEAVEEWNRGASLAK